MRKVQFLAAFWTLVIAIPFTALALSGLAYLTDNYSKIARALSEFSLSTSAGGRGLLAEFAARSPEIAGMVIGQIVILTILLFVRRASDTADEKE